MAHAAAGVAEPSRPVPGRREATERPFTPRAVILGIALTAFFAWFSPYSYYRLVTCGFLGTSVTAAILPPGVVAVAIFVLAANYLLGRLAPRRALRPGELAVSIAMLWLGASAFQIGLSGNTPAIISAPEYFASPENRWADYYLAWMPSWIAPSNQAGGIRQFYNGLGPGQSVPWGIWYVPFFWWGSLILVALGAVICLMAIVHEQWHDHEKLTFPLAEIPLMLVGQDARGGHRAWAPAWMRSRLFWTGVAISSAFIVWNILNWFSPMIPHVSFTQDESTLVQKLIPNFYTKVDFFTIGIAYFAPLSVLRGYWIGRLLIGVEMGAGTRFGFGTGMNAGSMPWSDWGSETVAWQCFGSLAMWVFWGFWIGREHFGKVLRSAFGRPTDLPEHLRGRYRAAAWGLMASLAYLALWFHTAGMSWPVIALFLLGLVILTLGVAKVVVESCLLYVDSPINAQSLVLNGLGTAHIPQASMMALAFSYAVFRSNAGMMMPQVAFAAKMGDEHRVARGKLYAVLGVAVLVTIIVAVVTTVAIGYEVGAFNFRSHPFRVGHVEAYNTLARAKDDASGPDWYRLAFFGGGMALMAAILLVRARFADFWLHPVGITFASTSVAGLMAINIFLAWLAKLVLTRVGGIGLVNRAKPLFLGLVCGHSLGVALGVIVDTIWFRGAGHLILTGWGAGG